MHSGYLYIETHPDHPHRVRPRTSIHQPDPASSDHGARIRYIAWFEDIDAGEMHAHEFMRRFLLDLNNRIYKVDLTTAIADVESIRLKHRRIWYDPELTPCELDQIRALRKGIKRRQDRVERIINTIGYAALGLLAFNLLVLLLAM
ncbi:MAG TPA: hypothetical protein ENJ35_09675 [Gammaproteobacteria bacterium]|nr:hypothetical protein [Gammaproteobacteria bacterium]